MKKLIAPLVVCALLLGGCTTAQDTATVIPTPWGKAIMPKDQNISFDEARLDPTTGELVIKNWESSSDASTVLGVQAQANNKTADALLKAAEIMADTAKDVVNPLPTP